MLVGSPLLVSQGGSLGIARVIKGDMQRKNENSKYSKNPIVEVYLKQYPINFTYIDIAIG